MRVTESDDGISWESTHPDAADYLTEIFRLEQDYSRICRSIAENDPAGVIEDAIALFPGLRVINEPLFPTLISFLCSSTKTVPRIHKATQKLAHRYGDLIEVSGREYAVFPTVAQLTKPTKSELKETGIGYRARYIASTVRAITENAPALEPLPTETADARAHLRQYHGVGPKTADCVLLYGGGLDSVVPVDTRIDDAIEKYYPEYANLSEETKARKLEDLYGEYAGHAQLYLFHFMSLSRSN